MHVCVGENPEAALPLGRTRFRCEPQSVFAVAAHRHLDTLGRRGDTNGTRPRIFPKAPRGRWWRIAAVRLVQQDHS